jgi:tetratricopeptide (TPR) repeat protein
VLSLQGELVAEIAKEVKVAVAPIRRGWLVDRPAVDPVAYDLYLRGRVAWGLRGDEAMKAAVQYFQQAIDRQPTFALAYAGLADSYVLSATATGGGAPDARQRALTAATRALELDPSLAEAHTSLAGIHFFQERNLAAAEREFLRALELNPGYPTAHQWYAILLSELGRDEEALTHAREAVLRDPLSGTKHQSLGLVHYYGRRYDEAITSLRKALELSPQLPLPRALLAKSLFQRGDYAEAVRVAESAPEPRSADLVAITGLAYQRLANPVRANEALVQLQRHKPPASVPLAYWYAVNGQRDAAIAALERRVNPSVLPAAVSVDPLFDNLRDDARFKALTQSGTL